MKIFRVATVIAAVFVVCFNAEAIDHKGISVPCIQNGNFILIENGNPVQIVVDDNDYVGVKIAARTLAEDFGRVCGTDASVGSSASGRAIIAGSTESGIIKKLSKEGKIDISGITGKWETYFITTVSNPMEGIDDALVIAGSDKRGTIYGIYEISEQIGISPWYYWADVSVAHNVNFSIARGFWTVDEPAVKYRGIFLNDEAPCLTSWVKNTFGTDFGGHEFYAKCFELLLRLRANFMWPAMWDWAFYADDPLNSKTADDMGIVMGTSHHEPMARNHQEWARRRGADGVWDYASNKKVLDKFFREGIERSKDNEDLITIGMRGDGDTAMGGREGHDDEYVPRDEENKKLLENIIDNQRKIIRSVTRKNPAERQQVWALYKEVQKYYEIGLRVPDDVIILLSDDNWGDVRKLPNAEERKRKGGWGIYYHVDYVGAPRNSKWLNITPIQNMWEQLQLTYAYGVDKLWVLNVGDLKPMEYPITLFLDMARNPEDFTNENLLDHTLAFCEQQFGASQAAEAARILNLYSKYNGRITAEMMDMRTYDLESGEFKKVSDEYCKLEMEALRQYVTIDPEFKDAYKELILFPVQAMCNIYEMYYSQAMNQYLYARGDAAANFWADKVEACFKRDAELQYDYNKVMAGGKWDGMMTQKHIGYRSWNDNFPADKLPKIDRIVENTPGGFIFDSETKGYVAMEAEHWYSSKATAETEWTTIPYMGRTLSGVALMPYTKNTEGASLTYKMHLPAGITSVKVLVAVKSTLAFNGTGHRYEIGFKDNETQTVFFNERLNEDPANIYSVYYPTVAQRVKADVVELPVNVGTDGVVELTVNPLDPGIVFEKIVVDYGGYRSSYLMMEETPCRKN